MHTDPLALPTLFCLHHLGGARASGRPWRRGWERVVRCVAIDLAGFGDAAGQPGYTVAEMADAVAAIIRARGGTVLMIAGHSMGAKVAAVIARRAEDGEPGLSGLAGFVAVAGSPASPEPMDAAQRQRMLGWFQGDAAQSRAEAQSFVDQKCGPAPRPGRQRGGGGRRPALQPGGLAVLADRRQHRGLVRTGGRAEHAPR